jgi:glycerophosphoryl diester phosphodiesterase
MRRRRALLLGANAAAIAALAALGGWDVLQVYTGVGLPTRSGAPMEVVAHRGDLDRFPENTLEAILAATELGVDGVEFDTIMSADGTWWVMHDESLDRTTDGTGAISELRDADIEATRIDGGIGFDPARHADLRVPRLEAVLDALHGYGGRVYVDVQHSPSGAVDQVVAGLDGFDAAILCRTLADTRRVKQLDPRIATFLRPEDGPADASVDGWLMEAFFEADAGALQAADRPVITYVDQWRAGGDEAPIIRRAWAIGVTAFLTKAPDAAIEIRSTLRSSGSP